MSAMRSVKDWLGVIVVCLTILGSAVSAGSKIGEVLSKLDSMERRQAVVEEEMRILRLEVRAAKEENNQWNQQQAWEPELEKDSRQRGRGRTFDR